MGPVLVSRTRHFQLGRRKTSLQQWKLLMAPWLLVLPPGPGSPSQWTAPIWPPIQALACLSSIPRIQPMSRSNWVHPMYYLNLSTSPWTALQPPWSQPLSALIRPLRQPPLWFPDSTLPPEPSFHAEPIKGESHHIPPVASHCQQKSPLYDLTPVTLSTLLPLPALPPWLSKVPSSLLP